MQEIAPVSRLFLLHDGNALAALDQNILKALELRL